jgi:ATP-binding cassette subfamily A (ABC1) protein 1
MLLPGAMILILVAIRLALKDDKTFKPTLIDAVYPDSSITSFSFLDYITAVQTPRTCILKPEEIAKQDIELKEFNFLFRKYTISDINPYEWPVPFLKCDSRKCTFEGEDATDFCEVNVLAIAPSDPLDASFANSFEAWILDTYPQIDGGVQIIKPFDDPRDIDDYVTSANYGTPGFPKIAVAVVIGGSGKNYEYTIRTNSTNVNSQDISRRPGQWTSPSTDRKFASLAREASKVCELEGGTTRLGARDSYCTSQYMYNGALSIQRLVDDWIIFHSGANIRIAENGVSFVDFPSKEYTRDGFYSAINPYAPLLLILGFLFPISVVIRYVVLEKELRQKELMKMMSVSESALELSWFISFFGFFIMVSIFSTIASVFLYTKSSPVLLLLFWIFSSLAIVLFCLAVSALFSKSTRATLVGILFFFAGYFLTLSANYETGSRALISFLSIHPVSALTYGIQIIGVLEDAGIGLQRSTMNFSDSSSDLTFTRIFGSLLSDAIIWGFIMWYLNRVVPGDYGQSFPINFCLKSSYWCGIKTNSTDVLDWEGDERYTNVPIEAVGPMYKDQEKDGVGVHIRRLTKKFDDKVAVNELDLSMYMGQVTCLLGHNGAGKTTCISMLTGMLGVTSGNAIINGKSILTQMADIREDIGVCLQHDCLFPQLTVKEHIRFFARVKGLYETNTYEEAEASVYSSIKDVALYEKRNSFSKHLSGGMKRKLSLAIAFCGNSKIVFLDEPTSGMDPFSRRFTWNVIRENRADRCIVLTTHFMDEADILGDRIAILAQGQLRCVGSSLFLKNEYGVGYQITIEKKSNLPQIKSEIRDLVKSAVSEATVLSDTTSETTYRLPIHASDRFPGLFQALESKVDSGEISTYGVSITTMDEVFLCVARGDTFARPSKSQKSIETEKSRGSIDENNHSVAVPFGFSESQLFRTHVRALFHKRALNFKRDKKAWICSTILPILFSLFGFITVTLIIPSKNMELLELRMSDYNPDHPRSQKRFPVPVGNSTLFPCQPASCISEYDKYNNYCGAFASLNDSAAFCTDPGIAGFIDALQSSGKYPFDQDVSSVLDASETLFDNYEMFDLGSIIQYGAVYFTHALNSLIRSTSVSYIDTVSELCESNVPIETLDVFPALCNLFQGQGYIVATNFTAPHASLLFQGLVDEAIVRAATNDNEISIDANIHPMTVTKLENDFANAESSFSAWFYLVLSFPFISGTFATFIVTERMSKAKHLQTVAGVKPGAFWLSTFFWDMLNYQFPLWGVIILMYSFGVDAFTTTDRQVNAGTIVLMLLYGPAAAGFSYM